MPAVRPRRPASYEYEERESPPAPVIKPAKATPAAPPPKYRIKSAGERILTFDLLGDGKVEIPEMVTKADVAATPAEEPRRRSLLPRFF
jgi:hypothetical protein